MRAAVLAVCLVLPALAHADTPRRILIGTMAADHMSTAWGLSKGYAEKNPLYGWAGNDPVKVTLAGVAVDAAGLYFWTKYTKAKHPKIYRAGLFGMTAWRGYLTAKNIRTIRGGPA
jgi:hypothetical protein